MHDEVYEAMEKCGEAICRSKPILKVKMGVKYYTARQIICLRKTCPHK